MRKICFVTGTRAEYGLMSSLMKLVDESSKTQLQIIATNMHLSPRYGNTFHEIESDGFTIDKKVPIIDEDASDNAVETVKSMARALNGFAEAFAELQPDIVVVLGDRYELLAAASAALVERIPIAHIHGGEVTEGAYDDAIRHSITKMSSLHFTSTEEYRKRVIQLGEHPQRVFCVGALGVENIKKIPLMSKEEIETDLNFTLGKDTILFTYHPVTLGERSAENDIKDFIGALEEREDLRVVFTMPNSDTGSKAIAKKINAFVESNGHRARAYTSLGVKRYLTVMKYVGAVVGNSSSGILEAPSFGIPTLNIGDRQRGRIAADSVYNCEPDQDSIMEGLRTIMSPVFRKKAAMTRNPYERDNTAKTIFDIISTCSLDELIHKHFYDLR